MTQPPTDPEAYPPEEQPAQPAPEPPPPPPRRTVRPPVWPYFLTPVAVLIGAAAIVATIILTDDDPPPAEPLGPALESLSQAVDSLAEASDSLAEASEAMRASPAAPAPVTLRSTLEGYAAALDLDTAAFTECLGASRTLEAVDEQLQYGLDLGVNGTPSFFVNNKYISGAQPPVVFAEVIAAELAGSPTSLDEYSDNIRVLADRQPPAFAILDRAPGFSDAAIKGSPDATVVIVEFSDFQCPFCLRWYNDTLPQIDQQIGDDVALVFLHFPIANLHPNARTTHAAAECAGQQGKFWEMHDLLFERQAEWSRLPNPN